MPSFGKTLKSDATVRSSQRARQPLVGAAASLDRRPPSLSAPRLEPRSRSGRPRRPLSAPPQEGVSSAPQAAPQHLAEAGCLAGSSPQAPACSALLPSSRSSSSKGSTRSSSSSQVRPRGAYFVGPQEDLGFRMLHTLRPWVSRAEMLAVWPCAECRGSYAVSFAFQRSSRA